MHNSPVTLTPTTHAEVAASPFAGPAKRDHITLSPTKMVERWYWATLPDGTRIGFCAWAERPHNVARLKSLYISPEYRGQGHGSKMQLLRLQDVQAHGYTTVDLISRNPLWQKRQGWTAHRPVLKSGAQHLRMDTGRAITELLNT